MTKDTENCDVHLNLNHSTSFDQVNGPSGSMTVIKKNDRYCSIKNPSNSKQDSEPNELHDDSANDKRFKTCDDSKENEPKHSVSVLSQMKMHMRNNARNPKVEIPSTCSSVQNCSIVTEDEFPLTQKDCLHSTNGEVDFFGLPTTVRDLFEVDRGIYELYEWQKECLNLPSVLERKNLIYCLPTSGGKTLVAEILMMKELLINSKNVIFVLPYISIVQEKVRSLANFALNLDFSVEEYAGGKGQIPPRKRLKRNTIFVATIEKAHLLINSLFENNRIDELGLLVVDELHLLCEGGRRGSTLEIALTKIKCKAPHVHIIGMSATLTNIPDLKVFLNAELYTGNFRPVELKEFLKIENEIFEVKYKPHLKEIKFVTSKVLKPESKQFKSRDPDRLVHLLSEILPYNSCLIFCPTKKHCENLATFVIKEFPDGIIGYKKEKKIALLRTLIEGGNGKICPVLKKTIPYGVAYHHSGLTMEERALIEEAYSDGTLCCLACTSTLAAGVNLPAKRVIIRAPYVGMNWISAIQYKQMVGRAGRAGLDTSGESYLMVKPEEAKMVENILQSTSEASQSTLFDNNKEGFNNFVLNLAGLQLASSKEEIENLASQTLYAIQNPSKAISNSVNEAISGLIHSGHLSLKDNILKATNLGIATFKSGLDIDLTLTVLRDLKKAQNCLSLITHLHLLFIVTPYELMSSIPVENYTYSNALSKLTKDEQNTAKIIGIPESYVFQLMSGRTTQEVDKQVAHRFYLTLIIYDLWNQNTVWQVAQKFNIHRGLVCSLLSNASAFGSALLRFCQEIKELWPFVDLFPNFLKRLYYCCEPDLIELLELPCVKQARARQLSAAGFKSLTDIAKTTGRLLSDKIDNLPVRVANEMVAAAKMIVKEKADALREEADEMVIGLENMSE